MPTVWPQFRKKGLKDHCQTYKFATETEREKAQVNLQIDRFRLCKIYAIWVI